METSTKDRILQAALELFSQRGYEATGLRDLSAALGLSKSALYRHYAGKEAILQALMDTAEKHYEKNFGSADKLPPVPATCAELETLSLQQIAFTLHDTQVRKIRRLLTLEQYRSPEMAKLATKHFLTGIESLYAVLFSRMMDSGTLRRGDPQALAFAYTAPISALIHLCDREPDLEAEALEKMRTHIRLFAETYGVKR